MNGRRHRWAELKAAEIAARADGAIALVPVAATEQHGPHLPTGVDAYLNEGIVTAALARLPADRDVVVLPTQWIGKSNEHAAFAGTLTLGAETLIRSWTELAEAAHASGFTKILFFNSHGGQTHLCEIVAVDLRVRLGMLAAWTSWTALGLPPGLDLPAEELSHGIHGGAVETSMMLHLHPELVDMAAAPEARARTVHDAGRFAHLTAGRRVGWGWMAQDLHPSGAIGNARLADAALGRQLVEHAADQLVALLGDLHGFDLAELVGTPPAP